MKGHPVWVICQTVRIMSKILQSRVLDSGCTWVKSLGSLLSIHRPGPHVQILMFNQSWEPQFSGVGEEACPKATPGICILIFLNKKRSLILHTFIIGRNSFTMEKCFCWLMFYILRMSKITWFLACSVWLILFNMTLSRSIHVVPSGRISSFLITE